jgi:hypothetical protein
MQTKKISEVSKIRQIHFREAVKSSNREVIKCKVKNLVRHQKYARSIFVRQLKDFSNW